MHYRNFPTFIKGAVFKRCRAGITAGLLLVLTGSGLNAALPATSTLGAESHHSQTLKYVNYFIERYHYRKTRL
ncbi:MAG: hypothetical protein CL386_04190, partial [Acidiferrobacter sp.]|nr:hypothetical protein [Acidiferrobacter sp.]